MNFISKLLSSLKITAASVHSRIFGSFYPASMEDNYNISFKNRSMINVDVAVTVHY